MDNPSTGQILGSTKTHQPHCGAGSKWSTACQLWPEWRVLWISLETVLKKAALLISGNMASPSISARFTEASRPDPRNGLKTVALLSLQTPTARCPPESFGCPRIKIHQQTFSKGGHKTTPNTNESCSLAINISV